MTAQAVERGTWFNSSIINAVLEFQAEYLTALSAYPPSDRQVQFVLMRRRERRERVRAHVGSRSRYAELPD